MKTIDDFDKLEISGLLSQFKKWTEKKQIFEDRLVYAYDPSEKFNLKNSILEIETELKQVVKKLKNLGVEVENTQKKKGNKSTFIPEGRTGHKNKQKKPAGFKISAVGVAENNLHLDNNRRNSEAIIITGDNNTIVNGVDNSIVNIPKPLPNLLLKPIEEKKKSWFTMANPWVWIWASTIIVAIGALIYHFLK